MRLRTGASYIWLYGSSSPRTTFHPSPVATGQLTRSTGVCGAQQSYPPASSETDSPLYDALDCIVVVPRSPFRSLYVYNDSPVSNGASLLACSMQCLATATTSKLKYPCWYRPKHWRRILPTGTLINCSINPLLLTVAVVGVCGNSTGCKAVESRENLANKVPGVV